MGTLGGPLPALLVLGGVGVGVLVVVLLLVVARPAVALTVFVVVTCTNVSQAVPRVGPVSPYLGTLVLVLLSVAWGVRTGRLRLVWSPVLTAALVFLGSRLVSIAVATDPGVARATVVEEAKDVLVLVLVTVVLSGLPRWRPVIAAAVVALAALAGLSIIQEFVLGNGTTFHGLSNVPLPSELPGLTRRHSGPEADVNFWARTLVLFVPFALSLGVRRRLAGRAGWLAVAAALAGGVYLTQSRGGLLALAVAVLLWFALYLRSLVKVGLAVVVLAATAAVLVPGVTARLGSLGSVGSTGPTADQSLVDRAAVQRVGWAMVRDAPLLGVGAGNFTVVEPDYRRRLAPELSQVIAPHNVYLEMLAEGGVVGLAGWLVMYGTALLAAARSLGLLRALDGRGPPSPATLQAIAAVAALVAWAAASVVLHLADLPILFVVMAVAAALDRRAAACRVAVVARGVLAAGRGVPARRRALRRPVVTAIAAAAVIAVGVGLVLVPRLGPTVWTASTTVVVQPVNRDADAYVYDVLSRPSVVATYAALFSDRGIAAAARAEAGAGARSAATVDVAERGSSGALTITVASPDQVTAARLAPALVDVVRRRVADTSSLYAVRDAP